MTDKDHFPSSTHPPLPPTPEDEQFACLRLLRSRRVGIATYKRLLIEHGTAQNALAALPQVARAAGVSGYEVCPEGVVRAELRAAHAQGAKLLHISHSDYPAALAELEDAPPFLWLLGDPALLARPLIALVGARNASSLGTRMARTLAHELGEAGFVVVSGLARGIDAAAHLAALPFGTIAVQAGGVDVIYPTENTALAHDIAKQGLRLSEQPMRRNRIISGLARATVVVEAAAKSGSLITARDALDQGRDVLAVPGHPFDARAAGGNMLIRDGATLVRGAEDIITMLEAQNNVIDESDVQIPLPLEQNVPETRSLSETNKLHQQILDSLGPSPIAEDQLLRYIGAQTSRMIPILTNLEMDGQIRRAPGGMISRA